MFNDHICISNVGTVCANFIYFLFRHIRLNTASGEENIEYKQPSKKFYVTETQFVVKTLVILFFLSPRIFYSVPLRFFIDFSLKTSMVMCKCCVNICEILLYNEINVSFKQPISVKPSIRLLD